MRPPRRCTTTTTTTAGVNAGTAPTSPPGGRWPGIPAQPPVTGEATPNYLFHPHAPWWVAAELPEARLVVMLRDPVARAHSHWKLNRRIGLEELSFEEALDREEERIAPDRRRLAGEPDYAAYDLFHYSYVARGEYAEQLERWFAAVPQGPVPRRRQRDDGSPAGRDLRRCHRLHRGRALAPPELQPRPWQHRQRPRRSDQGEARRPLRAASAQARRPARPLTGPQ